MLVSVVDTKIKGHKNERTSIYIPTSGLLNSAVPMFWPIKRKNAVEKLPRIRVAHIHMEEAFFSLPESACISDIVGIRRMDIELVIAPGNIIKGSTMPVNIAYTLRASVSFIPCFFSIKGRSMVSML